MLNEQSLHRFQALSVPLVAEALTELGLVLKLAPGFHPMGAAQPLVGTAVTLRIANTDQERRGGYAHFSAALEAARSAFAPIFVIQSPDVEGASWDLVHAVAAKQHGVRGAIVDGAARDVAEMRELGFPLYATHLTPWPASRRADTISLNSPIHIGGEEVDAGDIILADGNGIVVVPDESLAEVLARAEQHRQQREQSRQRLQSGTPYNDALRPGQ